MAVYTEVADDELAAFVARYDIGAVVSCKGIAEGVENTNYLLRTEKGLFILTLYEKRVRDEDLPFFLSLLRHLAKRGVVCPQPVLNAKNEALGRLAGRIAVIVTFLDGVWPRRPDAAQCGMVGEALGGLHRAAADFPKVRANALSIAAWPALLDQAREREAEAPPGLIALCGDELAFLQSHWPKELPQGIIHADLFPDNVFFFAGKLSGLIDFYFACRDATAYDVAICLNAWCFEPDASFNITKGMALIAGYERRRPLGDEEVAALPILARGAALRFLLTRLVDWLDRPAGALVKPKNPNEYAQKLRFHQHAQSARDYGLLR